MWKGFSCYALLCLVILCPMVYSMTGFGRGEAAQRGISITVELRSVNNRFFELSLRLPSSLSPREQEIKELLRKNILRGKIQLSCTVSKEKNGAIPMKINVSAISSVMKLLNNAKSSAKLKENISLEHLLKFSEVFEPISNDNELEDEWKVFQQALIKAERQLIKMREREGSELTKDLKKRWKILNQTILIIEKQSKERIPEERKKLHDRVQQIIKSENGFNAQRIETEIALLADKLDITEECVRFRSHLSYFDEVLNKNNGDDSIGRKLTFLIQEIVREANTISSKTNNAQTAQLVVTIKEELEKIREQLQNLE